MPIQAYFYQQSARFFRGVIVLYWRSVSFWYKVTCRRHKLYEFFLDFEREDYDELAATEDDLNSIVRCGFNKNHKFKKASTL
jgi:hypothetical protein